MLMLPILRRKKNGQAPFFVAAAIAFINFVFTGLFLPANKKIKSVKMEENVSYFNFLRIIKNLKSEVGYLFILFFIAAFTLSSLEIIFPLFAQKKFQFNETNIGFFFTLIGITVGFTQGVLVGKVVKRFGEVRTVAIAALCMIIGYSALAISPNVVLLGFSAVVLAFGIALNEPSLAALISSRSKESQGVTLGATWSFDSLARIIGPAFGGFLYASVGASFPFFINSLVLILSLLIWSKIKNAK
ncbi:MAG: Major facilitator superfamily [Candidatus Woesebacteria bacterium GW2011_GWA1_38_8]|uniref:Major facilitator superfamily n=1 Tax=Candidatus Woesebacteria bacterium GW2011_GWA1_38_8 TaxID=1618547 RepID=A0A0G0NDN7_9BACT|nr:MAG: Major facilitator superfamily [Candidatus Woesebacteria bacterium GW2011_GWA1_38_8]